LTGVFEVRKKQQREAKQRVARYNVMNALREICKDWERPISAGEFARECGIARNTARKQLEDVVKAGFAWAVKTRRGDVRATYYRPTIDFSGGEQ
jgi:response regulator of citrate/malate metabolism